MRAIDADAAGRELKTAALKRENFPQTGLVLVDEIVRYLNTCPTLDVAPAVEAEPVRHGRWEKGGYACGETEWKCSVCGETEWRTSCSRMKFCMFCGAKMDAGQEDDENA